MAEAIDLSVLPLEYGGTAPPLLDTPFLPAVHRALELGATAVATAMVADADMQAGEDVGTGSKKDNVNARTMYSILRYFSLGGDGEQYRFERNISLGGGGGGSGGGIPFAMARGLGHTDGGFKSGAITGGGGLCLPSASGGATATVEGRDCGIACKCVKKQERARGMSDGEENTASKTMGSAPSQGRTSGGTSGDTNKSVPPRSITLRAAPIDPAASVVALPASTGPPTAGSPSSDVITVRQQYRKDEGCNDNGEQDNNDHRGDLEWVLDVVPGARLAATVAGNVASVALGATLGAAGFAAGVVEAVVPGQVWAEGVQVFQSAQFIGGWALGH